MPLQNSNSLNKHSIITFDNVSFSYQNSLVLKDVSFKVFFGEFIGMIGPNGGGKTTLLKLIMGLLKPSKGSIKVFGNTHEAFSSRNHKIAYVPQSVRLDRDFPISVEEVVLSGLIFRLPWYGRFCADDYKAVKEALDKTGLSHLMKHPFGKLSGGQAQRVLIARALVSHPQLLLLDEPTASVDNQAEADIYAILDKLKGHMTILMVTHDLGVAINQVERIFCIQSGVISLKPEEVCKHFAFGLYHKPLIQSNLTNPLLPSS
jgi:zinc transport system ATP-binding protein